MKEQLEKRIEALGKEMEQDIKLINALRQQLQNQEKVLISKQGGLIELKKLVEKELELVEKELEKSINE